MMVVKKMPHDPKKQQKEKTSWLSHHFSSQKRQQESFFSSLQQLNYRDTHKTLHIYTGHVKHDGKQARKMGKISFPRRGEEHKTSWEFQWLPFRS